MKYRELLNLNLIAMHQPLCTPLPLLLTRNEIMLTFVSIIIQLFNISVTNSSKRDVHPVAILWGYKTTNDTYY